MYSGSHIADAVNVIKTSWRVKLISCSHQNRQAAAQAPPPRKLIIDGHVEEVIIILNLIVIDLTLLLFIGTDEMARRRLITVSNGDVKVVLARILPGLRFQIIVTGGA